MNGAADNPAARAILESTVDLAKKLKMSIVAEGVESPEDWDLERDRFKLNQFETFKPSHSYT